MTSGHGVTNEAELGMMGTVLWRADEHEELTSRPWDERVARDAIEAIVLDAVGAASDGFWPGHPRDDVRPEERFASLYLGSAGMIWALWKLGAPFEPAAALSTALAHYRAKPDSDPVPHPPSLLVGETGLLLVAVRLGSPLADLDRLRDLVRANRAHPSWELMWGSPGTMLAARAVGLDAEWEDSARLLCERWDPASELWTQELDGRSVPRLGPVHGFAGNVHAIRGYVPDEVLRERTARALERTALRHDGMVNWPPLIGSPPSKIRVQWCHGAPGIISTVGDLIPQRLSLAGGELIWRAGPLRKGAGLCHGTAGNGFAFLKLYELTGQERWLFRARRFAMHAIEQVEQQRSEVGRGRYTLMTGDVGAALYIRACLEARAAFPIIDEL